MFSVEVLASSVLADSSVRATGSTVVTSVTDSVDLSVSSARVVSFSVEVLAGLVVSSPMVTGLKVVSSVRLSVTSSDLLSDSGVGS